MVYVTPPFTSAPDWVRDAVFYQIFPDRFLRSPQAPELQSREEWETPPNLFHFKGGDLEGVRQKLGYLKDLGVNALYFNPVFASTANHRYHTYDYYQIDPILGGNDAFKRLLDAAHALDMRVVLDGVFNHASRGFYQFNHTLENGAASPYLDWFHFNREWLARGKPMNAYGSPDMRLYDAPAEEISLSLYGYRCWWDIPSLPKFNTENPQVREFLLGVAEHWVRVGIDGWRLDVPSEIDDDDFWREFRRRVRSINPEAYIVGEIWDDATRWLGGDQFDAVMNYPLTRIILGFVFGDRLNWQEVQRCGLRDTEPLAAEAAARQLMELTHRYAPSTVGSQFNLLGSHDTPRLLTMGNGDIEGVKLAFSMMFTLPGAPCIYYGDEIGMAGGHDPDCRRGFEWDERLWNRELRNHVQKIAHTRISCPPLTRGNFEIVHSSGSVLAYLRTFGDRHALVALNVSHDAAPLAISVPAKQWLDVFSSNPITAGEEKTLHLDISPRSAVIIVSE